MDYWTGASSSEIIRIPAVELHVVTTNTVQVATSRIGSLTHLPLNQSWDDDEVEDKSVAASHTMLKRTSLCKLQLPASFLCC